jgi:large subunit ribosomal protein L18
MASKNKAEIRRGVHSRIRKKVSGTEARPRLAVFRSLNHIYAQVIDDDNGKTLVAASTTEKDLRVKSGGTIDAAQTVGKTIAERAIAAGISQVVFDRGGYVYHGRVKALLDATRESGLNKTGDTAASGSANNSGENSIVENVVDTVSAAVKNVAESIGDAITNLVSGDNGGEQAAEQKPKAKKKKKETNENE